VIACDVNVLVYAYNEDAPRHVDYRAWLERAAGPEPFGLAPQVESGFVRVVTHPKVLD
jgi:predicted nucleic acid-binding protein